MANIPLRSYEVRNLHGASASVYFDIIPDRCPICHTSVSPRQVTGSYIGVANTQGSKIQIVFQCTNSKCEELFITTYLYEYDTKNTTANNFYLFARAAPVKATEADFSEEIREVSPTFVEIYNQAIAAEAANLNQISGIGLRKALEFLIKDFAVNQHPTRDEEIKKAPLAQRIKNFIDDPNLKEVAQRATWLGNDETHYTRKWLDRDINDLKVLIKLTVNWINNALLTQKYIKEMNP